MNKETCSRLHSELDNLITEWTKSHNMAEENKKPVIGEMISNFPVEELKRMITNVDCFDIDGITPEKEKAVELEEKLDKISENY